MTGRWFNLNNMIKKFKTSFKDYLSNRGLDPVTTGWNEAGDKVALFTCKPPKQYFSQISKTPTPTGELYVARLSLKDFENEAIVGPRISITP